MSTTYALAESIFTIAGTTEYVRDEYADPGTDAGGVPKPGSTTATVAMGLRGDASAEQEINLKGFGSDDDFSISTTPDGRLTAISYKAVGIGGRLVEATASILAFVGSIAAAIGSAGAIAASTGTTTDGGGEPKPAPEPKQTPEDRAKAKWGEKHPVEAKLLTDYTSLVTEVSKTLAAVRKDAGKRADARRQTAAIARTKRLELLRADALLEVDRLTANYKAWRSPTITTRMVARSFELPVKDLPVGLGTAPNPVDLSESARAVWNDLGVIVQIAPGIADPPAATAPYPTGPWIDYYLPDAEEASRDRLRWRLPRPIRVWIWRRGPADAIDLERTFPTFVVDGGSRLGNLKVDRGLFGDHSAQVEFGEYGMATKVSTQEKGAIGMFADAIAKVPGQVTAGLENAQKAQVAASALIDTQEQRRLDAVKRRVETLTKELEEKGLTATQGDYVRLKELEQRASLSEAEAKLEPASDLALLKQRLETLQTEASIRQAQLEFQLAEMYAQMATPTNPRRVPKPSGPKGP